MGFYCSFLTSRPAGGSGGAHAQFPWRRCCRLQLESKVHILYVLVLLAIHGVPWAEAASSNCNKRVPNTYRPHSVSITEFGALGDGVTLNTKAFHNALYYLKSFADKGGAQLFVPAGRWLTGSFSLISHLTLSLDKNAIILGSMDPADWPIIDPLPSYGRGRDLPGGRHQSLIFGFNLTDVIITGGNGTIDGQGNMWWDLFKNQTLDYTRPHLVEFMHSTDVVISNVTFTDSPFWAIHPVYCSQVLIHDVTVLAPPGSPNTDGIDPDSSENVWIEDCYIRTGDDVIVIKSGWDEYGILYGRPSFNISIRRVVGEGGAGAGIAFGSEMSGGISEVHAEDVQILNMPYGIRLKTSPGRGGYIQNIHISDIFMTNVSTAIRFQGSCGEHPDDQYDPNALPTIKRITIERVVGENITLAGGLVGIRGDRFSNICLSDVVLNVTKKPPWKCAYVEGYSNSVFPDPCDLLKQESPEDSSPCYSLYNLNPQSSSATRFVGSNTKLPFAIA